MKRTKELRSCVSFKRNWPLNLRIFFSHNSPSLCWTDMVFCKRIELSITDRESYDIWTNLFAQYWFRKSKPVFARCINRLGVGEERGRGWGLNVFERREGLKIGFMILAWSIPLKATAVHVKEKLRWICSELPSQIPSPLCCHSNFCVHLAFRL